MTLQRAMLCLFLCVGLCVAGGAALAQDDVSGGKTGQAGYLLPAGYLTTAGNQIVSAGGLPVRLACVGYFQPGQDIAADLRGMVADGFNCLRYPWYDATLPASLATADRIVAAATLVHMKVILDHHGNEVPGPHNGYLPYPCNGLPFDTGPGTDGTDGCGDTGTVSRARYVQDLATVARRYAGNPAVIGFDLTNEPHLFPAWYAQNPGGATWGTGTATDLRLIYRQAGNAVLRNNPHALIFAEAIQNWTTTLASGAANAIAGAPDLSLAGSKPIGLSLPRQTVYSVHDYPGTISGTAPDSGTVKLRAMNTGWGFLVSRAIAPVWIGEMGASLDGVGPDNAKPGQQLEEQKWAALMIAYVNGRTGAAGGPTFTGCKLGIGTDWWAWGNLDGYAPDGTLLDGGRPRPQQQTVTRALMFVPAVGCG